MTEPKQLKKRIVSKPKYVAHLAEKTTLKTGAFVMASVGVALVCAACCGGLYALLWSHLVVALAAIIVAGVGAAFIRGGWDLNKTVGELGEVLPATRQNIEQLPAEETLVRASTEPIQGKEKVLLRAATVGAETLPKQLLRAEVSPAP